MEVTPSENVFWMERNLIQSFQLVKTVTENIYGLNGFINKKEEKI
jgi:hypothetical protein